MQNFAYPYFSRDIAEFWRRWHISLSTWFRDYLYIPLGGSRGSRLLQVRNIFIIFIVSGFWHGANWTFIVWGAINAFYFLPLMLLDKNRMNLDIVAKNRYLPTFKEFISMAFTFGITLVAWIFFRAENITHAFDYLSSIFTASLTALPEIFPVEILVLIVFFFGIEWIGKNKEFAMSFFAATWPTPVRWSFYSFIVIAILTLRGSQQEFIYFQF